MTGSPTPPSVTDSPQKLPPHEYPPPKNVHTISKNKHYKFTLGQLYKLQPFPQEYED